MSSAACLLGVCACVRAGVVREEYDIVSINYIISRVLCIHTFLVDLVTRAVLTLVDEIPCYTSGRSYYFYFSSRTFLTQTACRIARC